MDEQKLKELYEEKYQEKLGMDFGQWIVSAPNNEQEAYDRLEQIDLELKATEEIYQELQGDGKWELGETREKLRNEYQLIEELFGLESHDE